MNPHDAATRPGAHLVATELGVGDPWDLVDLHPPHSPLGAVGRMVALTAHEVDDLHGDLVRVARSAMELLEPLSQGKVPAMRGVRSVLEDAGPRMDLIAARRAAAYEHLTRSVTAYQRLLSGTADNASVSDELNHDREQAAQRAGDWAIADGRQIQALRAVQRGGLRLEQSALSEQDRYLSDGSGTLVPIWAVTIDRMLADGLLDIDTSTRPVEGQLLSLTPLGQEALRTHEQAPRRRPSAALARTPHADTAASPPETAKAPPSPSAPFPTRHR